MPDNRPIGVFDSGIGGLTLAHALTQALPDERLIFFGDTAHLPYGDKSAKAILAYTQHILKFLAAQNCKAVVIACNTASAVAYPHLKQSWHPKLAVFNVIDPVVNYCLQVIKPEKAGVIGTKSTIRSRAYPRRFEKLSPHTQVTTASAPLLAPMIEEGFYNNTISRTLITAYLDKKQFQGIGAMILGCTHYPLIRNEVEEYYEGQVAVLDNISPTVQAVQAFLKERDMLSEKKWQKGFESFHHFYVSDYTIAFEETAHLFFGASITLEQWDLWGLNA